MSSPAEPSELTRREREYRATLERRVAHLEERLRLWDPRRDPSRTRGELAALRWVLRLIDACDKESLLPDLREFL